MTVSTPCIPQRSPMSKTPEKRRESEAYDTTSNNVSQNISQNLSKFSQKQMDK